ncbi:MAG: mechanosensitive ion channel family protein [Candidatus Methylarchaceae archaeon HK01B]|nr:mechanosensitive ion channel family protein [Candidatus Methylarchaceae archaeon HK01B]
MALEGSVELTLTITILATILGALGFSLAFKDYTASLMAGLIFKRVKQIKSGTRVKILSSPIVKGDILEIGWFRTTLNEVGNGERLPSVKTGRISKIPNFLLFSNAVLIYGESIIDEVVAYIKGDSTQFDKSLIENMARAIEEEGNKVIAVSLYQKENNLIVHGIFESNTQKVFDARSNILARYLEMNR